MRPLSLEEYVILKRKAQVKRQLVEGFPRAMARATGATGWW